MTTPPLLTLLVVTLLILLQTSNGQESTASSDPSLGAWRVDLQFLGADTSVFSSARRVDPINPIRGRSLLLENGNAVQLVATDSSMDWIESEIPSTSLPGASAAALSTTTTSINAFLTSSMFEPVSYSQVGSLVATLQTRARGDPGDSVDPKFFLGYVEGTTGRLMSVEPSYTKIPAGTGQTTNQVSLPAFESDLLHTVDTVFDQSLGGLPGEFVLEVGRSSSSLPDGPYIDVIVCTPADCTLELPALSLPGLLGDTVVPLGSAVQILSMASSLGHRFLLVATEGINQNQIVLPLLCLADAGPTCQQVLDGPIQAGWGSVSNVIVADQLTGTSSGVDAVFAFAIRNSQNMVDEVIFFIEVSLDVSLNTFNLQTGTFPTVPELLPTAAPPYSLGTDVGELMIDPTRGRLLYAFTGSTPLSESVVVYDCAVNPVFRGYALNCLVTITNVPSAGITASTLDSSRLYGLRVTNGTNAVLNVFHPADSASVLALGMSFGCLDNFLPRSFLNPGNGQDPCVGCDAGQSTEIVNGVISCTDCPIGTFTRQKGSDGCTNCDPNAVAPVPGSKFCLSKPGFIPSQLNPDLMLRCASVRACPGGNVCGKGYEGQACSSCAKKHFRSAGGACEACPSGGVQVLKFLVLLVVLIALLVAFVVIGYIDLKMDLKGKARVWFTKLRVHLTLLGVFIGYAQIIAILRNLQVEWSPIVLQLLDLYSAFNFNLNLVSAECSSDRFTYSAKWILGIGARLSFVGMLWMAYFATRMPRARTAAVGTTLFIYAGLLSRSLEVFDCTQNLDGTWSMDVEPSRACYEGSWFAFAVIGGLISLVYGLGVPVTMLITRKSTAFDELGMYKFHRKLAMWEVLITARKFFFIAFIMFNSTRPVVAALLAGLVILICLVAHAAVRPYKWIQHNVLEVVLLTFAICILTLGIALASKEKMDSSSWNTVQTFAILFLLGAILVTIAVIIWGWLTLDFQEVPPEEQLGCDDAFDSPMDDLLDHCDDDHPHVDIDALDALPADEPDALPADEPDALPADEPDVVEPGVEMGGDAVDALASVDAPESVDAVDAPESVDAVDASASIMTASVPQDIVNNYAALDSSYDSGELV